MVRVFRTKRRIPNGVTCVFFTITSAKDPIFITDHHLISLIRWLYKIIAKVLVNRLKRLIGSLVSKSLSTFIKNRNIMEDPLITNALIVWAKSTKKKLKFFKVDF